jgi:hypothetical protein
MLCFALLCFAGDGRSVGVEDVRCGEGLGAPKLSSNRCRPVRVEGFLVRGIPPLRPGVLGRTAHASTPHIGGRMLG